MTGYLIDPQTRQVRKIRLSFDQQTVRRQLEVYIGSSQYTVEKVLANGDTLCFPLKAAYPNKENTIKIFDKQLGGIFTGPAVLLGQEETDVFTDPKTKLADFDLLVEFL